MYSDTRGMDMKAIVDIFSGFLGSGKTMLIKKLLNENAYGKNTVIIENEFGEVSIDGAILKECNLKIKEINAGCICCQVSGDFGDSVLEVIRKYEPENIIIEPSGVAKLSEILKILEQIKFIDKIEIRNVFTLIDVNNYNIYLENFKEFYLDQIKNANKIVISRTQFVDRKIVDEVNLSLQRLNRNAIIFSDSWDNLKKEDFMKNLKINENVKKLNLSNKSNIKEFRKEFKRNHNANDLFESYPIHIDKFISAKELEHKFKFISADNKYGKIIRAKGIIKDKSGLYYQFDYVPNEFKIREIKWSSKKVISIIGSELNKKELVNLFS